MTLFKAVEAAREALGKARGYARSMHDVGYYLDALAALPAEPMTEAQIKKIIREADKAACEGGDLAEEIMLRLKAADCLYVKED